MDLILSLYKEYTDNDKYVFYKDNHTIIIFEKTCDNLMCISETYPKKYFADSLKIVLMFLVKDPYKLVPETYTYKMNYGLVKSYCYKNIEDACNLIQIYYTDTEQKACEGLILDDKKYGLWQYWYENGEKSVEGHYINGKQNGLWQLYHRNGEKDFEEYFVNGIVTCASNSKPMRDSFL